MMPLKPREGQRLRPEEAEALARSIAREVERSETERKAQRERHHRSRSVLGVVILLLSGWAWLLPPSWLVPDGPAAPTPERAVEELQLAIYLQSQVVAGYHEAMGRLPRELPEAGAVVGGLRYIRTSPEDFILSGLAGNDEVSFHSEERTATLLRFQAAGILPRIQARAADTSAP
ncbi:MAG: hypothetical protein WEA09_02665 [Gemmatimonadota bacterium]